MHTEIIVSLILTVISLNNSENKFPIFGKTDSKQMQSNRDALEVLKPEIKRYLLECGGENSEEQKSDSKYYKTNSSNSNDSNDRNSNNWNRYNNNDQNVRNSGIWNNNNNLNNNKGSSLDGFYGNNERTNVNRDNWNKRDESQSTYGRWSNSARSYGNYGNDMALNNRSNYGGFEHRPIDYVGDRSREYSGSMDDSSTRRRDYDSYRYGGVYMRSKRSEDDDSGCVAQCVLGYLEVLDDNRSPSESALVKWLQDHIPNDGKRAMALRETRRCFAKLAASDNEDGCDFSKALSNCLNLDIEK